MPFLGGVRWWGRGTGRRREGVRTFCCVLLGRDGRTLGLDGRRCSVASVFYSILGNNVVDMQGVDVPNSNTIQEYPLLMLMFRLLLCKLWIRGKLHIFPIQQIPNHRVDQPKHRHSSKYPPKREEYPERDREDEWELHYEKDQMQEHGPQIGRRRV